MNDVVVQESINESQLTMRALRVTRARKRRKKHNKSDVERVHEQNVGRECCCLGRARIKQSESFRLFAMNKQKSSSSCLFHLFIVALLLASTRLAARCQSAGRTDTEHKSPILVFDRSSSNSSSSDDYVGAMTANGNEARGLDLVRNKRSPLAEFVRSGRTGSVAPSDLSRVVAVSGQTIEFQCPLANELLVLASSNHEQQPNSSNGDHFTIIWRKDGSLLSALNPRLRLVQPQMTTTTTIESSGGQQQPAPRSSLTIQQARAKLDEATYECQLVRVVRPDIDGAILHHDHEHDHEQQKQQQQKQQQQKQQTPTEQQQHIALKSHRFQLKLLVAPRLAQFEFPQDAQVGQRILLTCSALEGQRPISFVWLKDNQIIQPALAQDGTDGPHGSSGDAGVSGATTVTLAQIHRRQLAEKFALSAHGFDETGAGETLSASDKSPAYVLIERAAPSSSSSRSSMSSSGQRAGHDSGGGGGGGDNENDDDDDDDDEQRGQERHNKQASTIAQLSDASIRVRQADDYSILTIDSLELKHAGRYTCSAQNEAARVSHSAQLTINAPPTLTIEPKDGDLVSGQSTVIECAAAGQPRPVLSWSLARESSGKQWHFVPIYEGLRYSILPNGSLSITNVTQREQGFYMCTARNGFGPEVTKLIKITVHEPARIWTKYKSVEARVDERAQLSCAASGELPLAVSWLDKAGNLIDKQDKRFVIDESDQAEDVVANGQPMVNELSRAGKVGEQQTAVSKLIIAKSSRSDSGHYTCQARNKHGQDKMILNLLVQDVPDKVNELKVTNVTATTISLRWQLGFTGNAPVTSYLIQYQSDDPLDELLLASATVSQRTQSTGADISSMATGGQQQQTGGMSLSESLATLLELEQQQQQQQKQQQQQQQQQQLHSSRRPDTNGGDGAQTNTPPATTAGSIKSALEALNSALGARLGGEKNSTGSQQSASNLASAVLDEAIDRTLVELTVEQSATNLVIKDLLPYCVYRLRLAGINKIGLGEFSEWIRAKTEESPPSGSALKISASATGPNSVKLSWLPPERRSWNGQLNKFNIAYRPLDSSFEMNKTIDWSPPPLVMSLLDSSGAASLPSSSFSSNQNGGAKQSTRQNNNNNNNNSATTTTTNELAARWSPYALKQHLRQLLALQQQELVVHLTNLQRSTTYLVWIQAANSRGFGPQSHAVSVKTLDDVPPSAPILRIQSTSQSSITIAWSVPSNFVSSANQYTLFYRRVTPIVTSNYQTSSNGNNESVPPLADHQVPSQFAEPEPFIERTLGGQQLMQFGSASGGDIGTGMQVNEHEILSQQQQTQKQHYQQFVYTLDQLECGSIYELYMTTRNSVGKSEPSPVVSTRTLGEPPLAPPNKNNLFARIGSQDVLLNLATWSTGGCPLSHISVRYKPLPAPVASPMSKDSSPAQSAQSTAPTTTSGGASWPTSTSVPASLLASINQQQQIKYEAAASSASAMQPQAAHGMAGSATSPAALEAHNLMHQPQSFSLQPAAPFALKNLQPSTGYELELSAHNSAGRTTAQYEFVTAGPEGSRISGYTRREGVYRLDSRGRPLEHISVPDSGSQINNNNNNNGGQLLAGSRASVLDHSAHHNRQQQLGPFSLSQQLVPLLLVALCLACLIVSSTFCYYRLAGAWSKRQRAGAMRCNGSNDDGDPDEEAASTAGQTSPSSTLKSARLGNWPNQRHQLGATTRPMNGVARRAHTAHLHQLLQDVPGEQTNSDEQPRLRFEQAKQQHQTGGQFISQSVSMRDLQLGTGTGSATLNLKSSANCRMAGNKMNDVGPITSYTIARTGRLFDSSAAPNSNRHTTNEHNCAGPPDDNIYTNQITCASANCHQQHAETSWNSAQPQQVMPAPVSSNSSQQQQQQQQHETYAVPGAQFHQDVYLDNSNPIVYQQPQQRLVNETYSGIDACIQHLLMSQQHQSNNGGQQQYAMLMGQKTASPCGGYIGATAQQSIDGYSAELEQKQAAAANCLTYALSAGRSLIDSSSGSSSGFGGDHSLSNQQQLQQASNHHTTFGSTAHECDMSTSTNNTTSSKRTECPFDAANGNNTKLVQYQHTFGQHQQNFRSSEPLGEQRPSVA